MKKLVFSVLVLTAAVFLFSGIQKSAGPPGCHAGEPPNYYTCTACHTGPAVNSGAAEVTFDVGGAESGYIPGQVYQINILLKKRGMQAAGFQFIALQNNDAAVSPGEITISDPLRTQTVDASNPHVQGCGLLQKVWVEHTYQGINSTLAGESSWSFAWTAPATDVGAITFYLAALESNFNGDENGDWVYTRSVISENRTSRIDAPGPEEATVSVFPNPTDSRLYISSPEFPLEGIELRDLQGRLLAQVDAASPRETAIELQDLNAGVYLLILRVNGKSVVRKVLLTRGSN